MLQAVDFDFLKMGDKKIEEWTENKIMKSDIGG